MKILFSPVGNTDPISENNLYDGAMLHICRHYDIDKVYMYMSEQIFEKEKADHRFTKIIEKLSERCLIADLFGCEGNSFDCDDPFDSNQNRKRIPRPTLFSGRSDPCQLYCWLSGASKIIRR